MMGIKAQIQAADQRENDILFARELRPKVGVQYLTGDEKVTTPLTYSGQDMFIFKALVGATEQFWTADGRARSKGTSRRDLHSEYVPPELRKLKRTEAAFGVISDQRDALAEKLRAATAELAAAWNKFDVATAAIDDARRQRDAVIKERDAASVQCVIMTERVASVIRDVTEWQRQYDEVLAERNAALDLNTELALKLEQAKQELARVNSTVHYIV